jgi:pyridoxamine 5'-phosphate oxidase
LIEPIFIASEPALQFPHMPDPRDIRIDYAKGELAESSVLPDAIAQFALWFDEAAVANLAQANVMTLATAGPDGAPSARVLLLKGFDSRGFVFFTNYTSRKTRELDANPRAAMVFFWESLQRQVRIEGMVQRLGRNENEDYFRTRPRDAQISAWASHQSGHIASRALLEQRQKDLEARFAGGPVPLPDFWGGFRLVPALMEFWQGRTARLHDRISYTRCADGSWLIRRLEP